MTTPTQGEHAQPEALRLALSIDLMDTFTNYQQEELGKAAAELRRQHARIAELEAVGAGGVQALSAARAEADSVLEDAARWKELRAQHEDDAAERCCVFAPNDMRECLVPVGSLPGELDAFIDARIAARKQGANHD